jgi:hypothetical protein
MPDTEPKGLGETLKEQIALVTLLVIFVGICATDAYYGTLSLGYQFLDLPSSHLVYRGITIIASAPWILIPYLLATFWVAADDIPAFRRWIGGARLPAAYLLVVGLLGITFPMARCAGRRAAHADLCESTSTLPRIAYLESKSGTIETIASRYRLLLRQSGSIIYFQPLTDCHGAALPNVKHLSDSEIAKFETLPYAQTP